MAQGSATPNKLLADELEKPPSDDKPPCKLCGSANSLNIDTIHQLENIPVHYFCLLFSSGLGQRGSEAEGIKGFLAIDVKREIKRGSRLKCTYCRKKGATVGCAEPRCKKTYHLPCGSAHNSLQQYYDQFKSFCKDHRPSQKTRKVAEEKSGKSDQNQCAICQERIIRKATAKTLWSPCCGGFHHRNCIQGLAVSSGRERFRCPVCEDNTEFLDEMRFYGIYVPEQDAPSEVAIQFQEVEQPMARLCHAKLCFYDQLEGRAFHSENGQWEILQCDVCGSRGIHAKCGGLEDSANPIWNCYICREVIRKRGEEPVTIPVADDWWKSSRTDTARVSNTPSEKMYDTPSEKSCDASLNLIDSPSDKSFNMPSKMSLYTPSDIPRDTTSKKTHYTLLDRSRDTPSEKSLRSRDASNSMFGALLASLPPVESGESSQPVTSQANASYRKKMEYKVTITPVIKSQKRRILSSKGPTVSSRPLWPSRKSTGSPKSASNGRPTGSLRSASIGGQTGSYAGVTESTKIGSGFSVGHNVHPSQSSVSAVLTLHSNSNTASIPGVSSNSNTTSIAWVSNSNTTSIAGMSSAASILVQPSSATVLSVPRVITHCKQLQNQDQLFSGYQEPFMGQIGATNGINLSVPVKRKNTVDIKKVDLVDNKSLMPGNGLQKHSEASSQKERNEVNYQKITSRTSLTDLITPILDAGPSQTANNSKNDHAAPRYMQTKAAVIPCCGQVPTSRCSQGIKVQADCPQNKPRLSEASRLRGALCTSGGTSFADLVTPILNSNNHLQVNLKKDHFAVSDEHEVSPGDSDYESSYEVKGAATREDLDAKGDGTKGCMEKRNNIVTITKHKKIVLSKNEYDRNGGQLRVTDFYPNKRN